MNSAASSFTSCVATSRISTTTTSQTPKATFFWRNSFSTRSGSLTIMRAMAESVDSETLNATTCVLFVLSTFTISSIAPTLFGRKTENCLTSGPPIFEVVSGKSTGISMAVAQASACGTKISQPGRLCHEALSHCRSSHCKLNIGGNQDRLPQPSAVDPSDRSLCQSFIEAVHFFMAQASCL